MKFLFNRKLPYDEIAILEELLRILEDCDEYDIERTYKCGSIAGMVSKFLAKRSVTTGPYIIKMQTFLPTISRLDLLDFILSDEIWRNFFDRLTLEESKNRIKYFAKHGIPYKLFVFGSRNAKTWLKINAKTN